MYIFQVTNENSVAVVIERSFQEALQRITSHHPWYSGSGQCMILARIEDSKTPRLVAYQNNEPHNPNSTLRPQQARKADSEMVQ